jgi:hypothetical protein
MLYSYYPFSDQPSRPVVAVDKPLREKLGDDGADSLVQFFNEAMAEQKSDTLTFVEEKFERRLSEKIGEVKTEIAETKVELITLISQTKTELMTQIANIRSELIKWMFIFWVGQLGMIIGILFAFFK